MAKASMVEGVPRKAGAETAPRFEAFGMRVKKGAAGRFTIGVEIELDMADAEAEPKALVEEELLIEEGVTPEEEEEAVTPEEEEAVEKPIPTSRLKLSQKGARFIARFEGIRLKLYNDPAGHCTIGIGHLVHRGRCTGREPAEFRRGITRKRAYALLQKDAAKAANAVRRLRVPLNQHQFDALVSFTYNVGTGWTKRSGLRRVLLGRRYNLVRRELLKWVHAGGKKLPGLVRRRRAEADLFAKGKYS